MLTSTSDRRRFPLLFNVLSTERITAHMLRVVLNGPGSAILRERWGDHSDSYVKLLFFPDGLDRPSQLDLDELHDTLPPDLHPVTRTYTVRHVNDESGDITIDFVIHGGGLASRWAADARPGATIHMLGPGGAYSPNPDADWHLLAADEAALPAALAALEAMPRGAKAHAFFEVGGPDDEQGVNTAANLKISWLHRGETPGESPTMLTDAVKGFEWPDGRPQVFVHGEAGLVKSLRSYLLNDRGVERSMLSISGYWRRGNTEQRFRVSKSREPKATEVNAS